MRKPLEDRILGWQIDGLYNMLQRLNRECNLHKGDNERIELIEQEQDRVYAVIDQLESQEGKHND